MTVTNGQADSLQRAIMDLRADQKALRKQLRRHELEHAEERARRIAERRRIVGWAIAIVAAVDGPVVTIILSRGH